jgi:hypothetical protein
MERLRRVLCPLLHLRLRLWRFESLGLFSIAVCQHDFYSFGLPVKSESQQRPQFSLRD